MEGLKPCPFCGGEVKLGIYKNPCSYTSPSGERFYRDEPDGYVISCDRHDWMAAEGVAADIAIYSWDLSERGKSELIAAWNTRAEHTCTINDGSGYDELLEAWFWHLSCGHISEESVNPPAYCPKCGAKVIS